MSATLVDNLKSIFRRNPRKPVDPIEVRVQETTSCRDCDYIPKVPNAGRIDLEHNPPVQIMHNGIKVLLGGYHGEWMQRVITALDGHHEPQEEKVFYEILKQIREEPVMIELGSYWAYYSLWFRMTYPKGRNYLVEPVMEKMKLGQQNFELNHFVGNFCNGCIGSGFKEQTIFVDWNDARIEMTQYSVDSIIEKDNIEFVDILHSDIQGAELDMLKGCEKSLAAKKIGYLCISTHGDKHGYCMDFLKQHGLHIIAEHSIEASASADGLIVAQSDSVPHVESVSITK